MMARSTCSNQRPDTLMQDRICQVDETSCNARPDHTFGSFATGRAAVAYHWCPLCTESGLIVARMRNDAKSKKRNWSWRGACVDTRSLGFMRRHPARPRLLLLVVTLPSAKPQLV